MHLTLADVAFWLGAFLAVTLLAYGIEEPDPTPESMLSLKTPLPEFSGGHPCLFDPPELFFPNFAAFEILEKCFPVQIDHSGPQ